MQRELISFVSSLSPLSPEPLAMAIISLHVFQDEPQQVCSSLPQLVFMTSAENKHFVAFLLRLVRAHRENDLSVER